MAELPDDDPRIPRRTFSLSEPRTTGMGLQGAWKETLWKTYYSVRSKVTSKSIEIDHSTQAWLLGSCYDVVDSLDGNIEKGKRNVDSTPPHVLSFLTHVYSVIWMTYRVRFQPLPQTTMTTDCGWGCMIRSGQMILANAINIHLLSKDWRLKESSKEHLRAHRKVLSWFREGSDGRTPFSLHKLIEVARHHGNQPGQWFGPAQVAVMIRDIVITSRQEMEEICNFTIVLAHDCTVYKKDVLDQMEREAEERAKKGDNREQAIMLLIPMRLGVDKLNPIYIDNIRFLLSLDQSLGIIGGRPKHSLYFIGYQGTDLIYLDPHIPQSAISADSNDFDIKSYHCQTPRRLAATKMDPSCAFGIYCKNKEEFIAFCQAAEKGNAPQLQRIHYPFFTIEETRKSQVQYPYSTSHVSLDLTRSHHDSLLLSLEERESVDTGVVAVDSNSSDEDNFVVISTS